jgi:hypothetical protein
MSFVCNRKAECSRWWMWAEFYRETSFVCNRKAGEKIVKALNKQAEHGGARGASKAGSLMERDGKSQPRQLYLCVPCMNSNVQSLRPIEVLCCRPLHFSNEGRTKQMSPIVTVSHSRGCLSSTRFPFSTKLIVPMQLSTSPE